MNLSKLVKLPSPELYQLYLNSSDGGIIEAANDELDRRDFWGGGEDVYEIPDDTPSLQDIGIELGSYAS